MFRISSQDFRNQYERFYAQMRKYLWNYQALKELAEIEANIYTAFIDIDKLRADFARLEKYTKEVCKEDELFKKEFDRMSKLINKENDIYYARLPQVGEIHPEKLKQIRTISDEEEDM